MWIFTKCKSKQTHLSAVHVFESKKPHDISIANPPDAGKITLRQLSKTPSMYSRLIPKSISFMYVTIKKTNNYVILSTKEV